MRHLMTIEEPGTYEIIIRRLEDGRMSLPKSGAYIFPNQYKAVLEAVEWIKSGENYIHLFGEMGVGKTGTMRGIAECCFGRRSYYLTGFADLEFRTLVAQDLEGSGMITINKFEKNADVLAGCQPGSLLFVDESHHGTGNRSLISGIIRRAVELELVLITVSATPACQFYSSEDNFHLNPKVVIIENPSNYTGLAKLRQQGRIIDSNSIPVKSIMKIGRDYANPRYMVFRVPSKKAGLRIIKEAQALDLAVQNWHHHSTEDYGMSTLTKAPATPTVIVLYRRLAMGAQVPKQHILSWYESAGPTTANDDISQKCRTYGYDVPSDLILYAPLEHINAYIHMAKNPLANFSTMNVKPSNFTKKEEAPAYTHHQRVFTQPPPSKVEGRNLIAINLCMKTQQVKLPTVSSLAFPGMKAAAISTHACAVYFSAEAWKKMTPAQRKEYKEFKGKWVVSWREPATTQISTFSPKNRVFASI